MDHVALVDRAGVVGPRPGDQHTLARPLPAAKATDLARAARSQRSRPTMAHWSKYDLRSGFHFVGTAVNSPAFHLRRAKARQRMNTAATAPIALSMALLLAACGDSATLPEQAAEGPNPPLPAPHKTFIPTVDIAFAKSWPEGAKPTPAPDLLVSALATGLVHPRWLYVLPNGDVLVAETNAPERPEEGRGVKGLPDCAGLGGCRSS